ncbi:phosphotransferase [Egicoccus sp. AB-alg6-2]|uniref:phosphotransferase n=1 Tax=Egicoccus sp. AB-alg6-2 TaxID=3242692 RepID=UPI00359E67AA
MPVHPHSAVVPAALPRRVLAAFGLDADAPRRHLGSVWLYDGAVLKPVDHGPEAAWCADVLEAIEVEDVRLPRPLRTPAGEAVVAGWCGWERLTGEPAPERWQDVLAVADRLYGALAHLERPGWLETKDDPWRRADRHAWGEAPLTSHPSPRTHPLQALLNRVDDLRPPAPERSPAQVVHLDLLGNVLFADGAAPAVIDPTFYWRPAGYAAAVVAVDAAAWTEAGTAPLEHLADRGHLDLLVRAARFRIARDVLEPDAEPARLAGHRRVVDWLADRCGHRPSMRPPSAVGGTGRSQRLHSDEVAIDTALAQRLVAAQHPGFAGEPLLPLATQGTDNVVFRLGERWSVRLPRKEAAVPGLLAELEWLPRLAPELPLPVPVPVAAGAPSADYPFPWAVCRWIDGTTPAEHADLDPADTATRLGRFVRDLQRIDTTGAPVADERTQRGGSLRASDGVTREALAQVVALIASGRLEPDLFDPAQALELWQAAVGAPAWTGAGVWLHRDLHLANLLAERGRLRGVVDFGGLVVGDPAGNAMAAWHVLPPQHRARFLTVVGADAATQLRARGWVLSQGLLALPYYLDTHAGMVRMARRAITAAVDTTVACPP